MDGRKIFNIGFHKTGTTSLSQFMHDLGFRVLHNVAFSMQHLGLGAQLDGEEGDGTRACFEELIDKQLLDNMVQKYEFFSDNPWPLLYQYLDKTYPGSQFILTRRALDSWVTSLSRSSAPNMRMRQLVYGYGNPQRHIARYTEVYEQHNKEVPEYFSGKNNLLVIDLEEDNQLISQKVLEFLGIEATDVQFPIANKG